MTNATDHLKTRNREQATAGITGDLADRIEVEPANDDSILAPCRPLWIPHPLEVKPRRRREPKWLPDRDRRDAPRLQPSLPKQEGWHSPTLHFAENGEAVRINFNYRNGGTSTSARFSVKARCTQYTEGPHESRYYRYLETDYRTFDFQFQIARIEWLTSTGLVRSYTFDGGRQIEDGSITFFEIKAHPAYFNEPETFDRLAEAEKELARHAIRLERIVGTDLAGLQSDIIDEVYSDPLALIRDDHEFRALELIEKEGGNTPLGRLRECLHSDPRYGRAIANAMLMRRIVAFPLNRPVTGDTPVHQPRTPPKAARSLRDLKI